MSASPAFQVRLSVWLKDGRVFSGILPWLKANARWEGAMKLPAYERGILEHASAPAPEGAIKL
jgi:hypothetical protein